MQTHAQSETREQTGHTHRPHRNKPHTQTLRTTNEHIYMYFWFDFKTYYMNLLLMIHPDMWSHLEVWS